MIRAAINEISFFTLAVRPFSIKTHSATEILEDTRSDAKDQFDQPIHYSESFRLAKRNVLFWSALTLVISFGVGKDPLKFVFIVEGVELSPYIVIIGSVLVLVFMAFGYFRAEERLLYRHSPFAYGTSVENAYEEFEQLRTHISELQRIVKGKISSSPQLTDAGMEYLESSESVLRNIKETIRESCRSDNLPDNIFKRWFQDRDRPTELEKERFFDAIRNNDPDITYEMRDLLAKLTDHSITQLDDSRRRYEQRTLDFSEGMARLNSFEIPHEFQDLSGRLKGLSKSIGSGEKRWFTYYDKAVVRLAVCVALFFAARRFALLMLG
ncbi:MAG: hypothetical protein AAFZ11_07505 [Pseudomonadota bacterium]